MEIKRNHEQRRDGEMHWSLLRNNLDSDFENTKKGFQLSNHFGANEKFS